MTEKSICEKYNVSRTPVREAFKQLEADGLIKNIPNRGAYVRGLTVRDISDLFDLRCIFEVQAVEWAIDRMSDEEIDKLKAEILADMKNLVANTDEAKAELAGFMEILGGDL